MKFGIFNHHDYTVIDGKCGCAICKEWRDTLGVYVDMHTKTGRHSQACGKCPECRSYFDARSTYLAARNRRELYCEFSWHASAHKATWGGLFMTWLVEHLVESEKYPRGWWEGAAVNKPLDYWLSRFDTHMITVSGSGWAGYSMRGYMEAERVGA